MSVNPVFWVVAVIMLLIIEFLTVSFAAVWFAAGALLALILDICHVPTVWQVCVFLIVSVAALFLVRPYVIRFFRKRRPKVVIKEEPDELEDADDLANPDDFAGEDDFAGTDDFADADVDIDAEGNTDVNEDALDVFLRNTPYASDEASADDSDETSADDSHET